MDEEFEDELWQMAYKPFAEVVKIECRNCQHEVELTNAWANACPNCHVEYNGSGQMLAPRSQWGEETGERF